MQRCSKKAFAMWPTRHLCGTREEATFADNSECAAFNKAIKDAPMTNADRIRAMSDEELAAVIMCPYDSDPDMCNRPGDCLACCIDWLQQPAKEAF